MTLSKPLPTAIAIAATAEPGPQGPPGPRVAVAVFPASDQTRWVSIYLDGGPGAAGSPGRPSRVWVFTGKTTSHPLTPPSRVP